MESEVRAAQRIVANVWKRVHAESRGTLPGGISTGDAGGRRLAMTFEQIFRGQTVLARAERHLSNRAALMVNGKLRCHQLDEAQAVDIMNRLLGELTQEFNARKTADRRKKRRGRAA
jgi:hypothetical protein